MKRILMAGLFGGLIAIGMTAIGCEQEAANPPPRTTPPPQLPATPDDESTAPVAATDSPASAEIPKETEVRPTEPASKPPLPAMPTKTPPSPPKDMKVAAFAGLTGPKPVTWIWRPPQRQFSVAEYGVPGRDGHDQASIDVFKAGGTIEANIQRWKTQFRNADGSVVEPKVSTLESDGMPITLVEFAGEYKGMAMDNFRPNQLFLCAIVEAPAGMVFIRFVGPAGTVEPNREDFMNMIRNLKKVQPEK